LTLAALAGAIALGAKPPAAGGGGTPQVRVDQVGYPTGASKRAYLMSGAVATGATFAVRNASSTVLQGTVGADLGSWSNSYGHVYPIDFDGLTTAGTYTIAVSGPVSATSTAFRVDTGANIAGQALRNSLAFYQVQRDGPQFVPSALRTAGAHLNDASAMTYSTPSVNKNGGFRGDLTPLGATIDASGGWWDAGDYLKFLHASTYTDALLLTGIRDFPAQMGGGGLADFVAEAKFGADWILRMWDDPNRILSYQVGIGGGNGKTISDHDIWRLPQADDTFGGSDPLYRYIRNRPVFRAGPPGALISPNLAGRTAAALALAYQVYRTSDPTFANRALLAAAHIFDLANTNPGQLTTAIPFEFYPETEWRDDLELGAVELHDALVAGGASLPAGLPHTAAEYLGAAATWANAYITGPNDAADTLNLYDVSGLAHFELDRAITAAGNPTGLATTHAALRADLKKALDGALAQGATDPFGFGFPWNVWDTTAHGAGLSVMASEYDQLTGTSTYALQADRWLANILGANAWGLSLIVGDGTTFPHCLQHQVANIAGSLDGSAPVLAGAAVEGPNGGATTGSLANMRACPANGVDAYAPFNGRSAQFKDNVESYSNTEPAIDLTATSPLAFARQAAGVR
jgi:endoglucanase